MKTWHFQKSLFKQKKSSFSLHSLLLHPILTTKPPETTTISLASFQSIISNQPTATNQPKVIENPAQKSKIADPFSTGISTSDDSHCRAPPTIDNPHPNDQYHVLTLTNNAPILSDVNQSKSTVANEIFFFFASIRVFGDIESVSSISRVLIMSLQPWVTLQFHQFMHKSSSEWEFSSVLFTVD